MYETTVAFVLEDVTVHRYSSERNPLTVVFLEGITEVVGSLSVEGRLEMSLEFDR